jgi:hypothetical protein
MAKTGPGYFLICFGDEATQYVHRMLDASDRVDSIESTMSWKNAEKIIEDIRAGYPGVITVVDESIKVAVCFTLDEPNMHIPMLQRLYEKVVAENLRGEDCK